MVITKLKGGLGNQMFQYAHGRSFAKKNNQEMLIDISWYKPENLSKMAMVRNFGLSNFNIAAPIATEQDLNKFQTNPAFFTRIARKIKVKIFKKSISKEYDTIRKSVDKKDFFIDGYWQKESFFKNATDEIRKEFTLKNELGSKAIEIADKIGANSVSLHMRNTDYLHPINTSLFAQCTPEYYVTASKMIAEHIDNPLFFIFSDDIEIAKKELKLEYPTIFISDPAIKDYEEMILMSKCKHNIIANSSFSWWAAWLNQNPQKIVIAPKNWYKDSKANPQDITPDSWIKI